MAGVEGAALRYRLRREANGYGDRALQYLARERFNRVVHPRQVAAAEAEIAAWKAGGQDGRRPRPAPCKLPPLNDLVPQ
jgi:hypothetical protein